MNNRGKYRVEAFPKSRIATMDIGAAGLKKHHIKALIEIDVTEPRKMIQERKPSEKVSFNSWLIKCISRAVEEFKEIHGIRKGKRKVVIFDDIDISIIIEREVDGEKVPLPYVIRQTNKKSISDIHHEIKNARKQSIEGEDDYVLGQEKKSRFLMKAYYSLPGFIRGMIWRFIINNPSITKQNMGTVMITSVGMMGRINGWVIPVSIHPLCFAIGSITKKPGVVDDRIEVREYLYVTVLVDHDIVDGAPAVRALTKLTSLVESGYGLP